MSVLPLSNAESDNSPLDNPDGELSSKGTPGSFAGVYELWFDEVSKWVRAMGGPAADRDDLVQDIFIIVHRRLSEFQGENLAGWLYQITRRKVRDFRRRSWVRKLVFMDRESAFESELADGNPLVSLETREKRNLLMSILEGLNDNERVAILLFEVEGYSGQKIAELQSVPINTVWTRIHKARQKLKTRLHSLDQAGRKRGDR